MTPSPALPQGGGRALFVGHDIYRRAAYGSLHPLAIPRVETVVDLCRALGGYLPKDFPMATYGRDRTPPPPGGRGAGARCAGSRRAVGWMDPKGGLDAIPVRRA